MLLSKFDITIIVFLFIGSILCRYFDDKARRVTSSEFFLSGKNMPWWLLGISIVSTTFSCDTPNLVTQLVREQGISGNWLWWCFLLTGMLNVFVYSKFWKKSKTLNDMDFYNIRYGEKVAKSIRTFRCIYLGFFFNCLVMATVNLAAIKIGMIFFGLTPIYTVISASLLVLFYTYFVGNHRGIWGDFIHFCIAMIGAIYAAVVSLDYVVFQDNGIKSLHQLILSPTISERTSFLPSLTQPEQFIPYFFIPLAAQWWMVWYPGAEPGGGGYVVEKMLAAKNERHSTGATLFYNIINYALRPWPWIIVAFCSLIIFPDLASIRENFHNVPEHYIANDIAYPAMISKLGAGWIGLLVGTLLLAYASAIGTHLNLGVSYLVEDVYTYFNKRASLSRHKIYDFLVMFSMIIVSATIALCLSSARQGFDMLLLIGAGTGPVYLFRWLWWRINQYSEISAMISAILLTLFIESFLGGALLNLLSIPAEYIFSFKLVFVSLSTTIIWIYVTLKTPKIDADVLVEFYKLTQPRKFGWKPIAALIKKDDGIFLENVKTIFNDSMGTRLINIFVNTFIVYALIFCVGSFVVFKFLQGFILLFLVILSVVFVYKQSKKKYLGKIGEK